MGKLATHEFAHGGPSFDLPWPPARNPWNTAHFTGGSSSGSGAAIAAGLVPATLGSDTGGSIRGPAGLCGIAGLKPTYGLVSRAGVLPNSYSYDHCGPMARTSQDCALILNAIAGHDPADPASSPRHPPDFTAGLDLRRQRHAHRRGQALLGKGSDGARRAAAGPGSRDCPVPRSGRDRRGRDAASAAILFRRQDRHRRERAVLAAPARADRQARSLRAGLPGAQPRRLPVHRRGLCAREPRAARHPGGDAAALSPIRSVPDRQRFGRTPPRPARHALVLEAAEPHLAVQLHRRAGARPAVRLHQGRLAAVAADRRPAVRRRARAAGGPRLRAGERILQAAPQR